MQGDLPREARQENQMPKMAMIAAVTPKRICTQVAVSMLHYEKAGKWANHVVNCAEHRKHKPETLYTLAWWVLLVLSYAISRSLA